MISDDVRERLEQALEADVRRYHQDTLVVRHQALCGAVACVLSDEHTLVLTDGSHITAGIKVVP